MYDLCHHFIKWLRCESVLPGDDSLVHGEVLFFHCKAGRGRTGLVSLPLISYVYNLPVDVMQPYLQTAVLKTRPSARGQTFDVPETPEQLATARSVIDHLNDQKMATLYGD